MSSSPPPPPPPPESGLEESVHGKEPVKPAAAAEGDRDGAYINIKITSQTAPDVFVRVKRDVEMERIMCKYCAKQSLDPKAVIFLNEEGRHIRAAQTAEEAGLEDGSSIDVHLAQDGGSGGASA